ncbi:hypothetical protein DCS_03603 [Drechmeria coniospora]|uniref:Uncharacterized protein n=1 Tax=Drechmeria coniospora TaxID=98403 RepID=A0A151GHT9_DRECN|nr:hypothetical protein DCS_03603 [Drechmeria coniospora]KYK56602.1 hypothetical protein DCS_03603 [Drechmeria coniospora]ODA77158.1 hypothetical protein RJ55_07677 [Drechmeria coniospora]
MRHRRRPAPSSCRRSRLMKRLPLQGTSPGRRAAVAAASTCCFDRHGDGHDAAPPRVGWEETEKETARRWLGDGSRQRPRLRSIDDDVRAGGPFRREHRVSTATIMDAALAWRQESSEPCSRIYWCGVDRQRLPGFTTGGIREGEWPNTTRLFALICRASLARGSRFGIVPRRP